MTMLLGLYLRLYPAIIPGFPLNDSALFLLMSEELRHNGYALPAYAAFNAANIPFAYPPLGFYVAAAIADFDE